MNEYLFEYRSETNDLVTKVKALLRDKHIKWDIEGISIDAILIRKNEWIIESTKHYFELLESEPDTPHVDASLVLQLYLSESSHIVGVSNKKAGDNSLAVITKLIGLITDVPSQLDNELYWTCRTFGRSPNYDLWCLVLAGLRTVNSELIYDYVHCFVKPYNELDKFLDLNINDIPECNRAQAIFALLDQVDDLVYDVEDEYKTHVDEFVSWLKEAYFMTPEAIRYLPELMVAYHKDLNKPIFDKLTQEFAVAAFGGQLKVIWDVAYSLGALQDINFWTNAVNSARLPAEISKTELPFLT